MFDADQQAVPALVVEMTRQEKVDSATFGRARAVLGRDALMFELVGVIAAYNMVSLTLASRWLDRLGHRTVLRVGIPLLAAVYAAAWWAAHALAQGRVSASPLHENRVP